MNSFSNFQAESKGRWWIVGSAFTGKFLKNLIANVQEDFFFSGNLVGSQQDGSKGSSQASSMSEQYR